MKSFWDERFDRDEYVYGTEPNEFVASVFQHIPKGKVLCLCEGEGRNAVFLARQGYDVTAVDASSVGLEKAKRLAAEHGVTIKTVVADLDDFRIEPDTWNGIIATFCHMPVELRQKVHAQCVSGLAPNGVIILEAFTPEQLNYKTGGPQSLALLMTLDDLKKELDGLTFKIAQEMVIDRKAGLFHTGLAAVVHVLGIKA